MDNTFEMVAKTYKGLEDILVDELLGIGAQDVEAGNRMVSFRGDKSILYKANLCCRTALRILKPIVKFRASDPDELYDHVRELDWEQFMTPDTTFAIDSTVNSEDFPHSRYVIYRMKDGICDHFNDTCGRRPSIRLSGADLLFNVHISDDRVTISLDSSGEPLSHRGYRVEQTEAPLSEVLAAGIIMKTGWRGDCDFADPMCGSGTFLIEAALIAANINPGIFRESFAFEKWPDFDADLFEELYNDDSEEREFTHKIYGGDKDPEAVAIARKNIRSARVENMIELSCRDFETWTDMAPDGVMVTNPPYGKRLRPDNIKSLYKMIGSTLKHNFAGWNVWILGLSDEHFQAIGLKPSRKIPINNGGEDCMLQEYVLFDGRYNEFRSAGGSIGNTDNKQEKRDNRPNRKNFKEFSEFKDNRERRPKKDFKGSKGSKDFKGKKDFKGSKGSKDFKDNKGNKAPRGAYKQKRK